MSRVAFVNANGVAIRIEDERHAANGRWKWFHVKLDSLRSQMRDGRIEVLDFQTHGTAVRAGLPIRRARPDGERAVGDVVFGPLHATRFADSPSGFQSQYALVKTARTRHVGDGIT